MCKRTGLILFLIIPFIMISCEAKKKFDKDAIIQDQTIKAEDILVYNSYLDLLNQNGNKCNFNIDFYITKDGISFEPTQWNALTTFVYGSVKQSSSKGNLLCYSFNGKFMREDNPPAAIEEIMECYLAAEVDTNQKRCNVSMLLDVDTLIFSFYYK